jgi:hypothetical protein
MTLKQSIRQLRDKIKDSPELKLADEEILVQNTDSDNGVDKLIREIRIGTIVACHALAYCKRTDDRSILILVDDFQAKVSVLSIDDNKKKRWW